MYWDSRNQTIRRTARDRRQPSQLWQHVGEAIVFITYMAGLLALFCLLATSGGVR